MEDFLETLLHEAEEQEKMQTQAFQDLVLIEIRGLKDSIAAVFSQAEEEIAIINEWALKRSVKLQDKIDFLAKKLEAFMRDQDKKTIDLPNGILKIRKAQNRVEIEDLDAFLTNAPKETLSIVPETVKPDLSAIKAFIKRSGRLPEGVRVIEGTNTFSYKLKNGKEKTNGESKQT